MKIIFLFVLLSQSVLCQKLDTILVTPTFRKNAFVDLKLLDETFCLVNDSMVDEEYYLMIQEKALSLRRIMSVGFSRSAYFVFYNADSVKVEEGRYNGEHFIGLYKEYHPNGFFKNNRKFFQGDL